MSFYLFINDNVQGPYAESELRDMLRFREITSRTPVCREGEAEWQAVEALLTPEVLAPTKQQRQGSPVPARFSVPTAVDTRVLRAPPVEELNSFFSDVGKPVQRNPVREQQYSRRITPGIGRRTYFFGRVGSSLFWGAVLAGSFMTLSRPAMYFVGPFILLLDLAVHFWLVAQRLENIGMAKWECVLLLVPGANFFVSSRCLTAPEGFQKTHELDLAGKVVFWTVVAPVMVLATLLFLGALAAGFSYLAAVPSPKL